MDFFPLLIIIKTKLTYLKKTIRRNVYQNHKIQVKSLSFKFFHFYFLQRGTDKNFKTRPNREKRNYENNHK